jgi:hypothetical protein
VVAPPVRGVAPRVALVPQRPRGDASTHVAPARQLAGSEIPWLPTAHRALHGWRAAPCRHWRNTTARPEPSSCQRHRFRFRPSSSWRTVSFPRPMSRSKEAPAQCFFDLGKPARTTAVPPRHGLGGLIGRGGPGATPRSCLPPGRSPWTRHGFNTAASSGWCHGHEDTRRRVGPGDRRTVLRQQRSGRHRCDVAMAREYVSTWIL